jgi:polyphosphate kinase
MSMQELAGVDSGNVALPQTLFLHKQLLFNREISWLEFNQRVLEEALDPAQPLLERVKFLSIFSTNLDEFFMIRVAGLKQQIDAGVTELSPDGMTPVGQLQEINDRLKPMIDSAVTCLEAEILPGLAQRGIMITPLRALSDHERRTLNDYFIENVFPVLTPLAVDPAHPFPYISNLSLSLGVMVSGADAQEAPRFARIKVPPLVPRLVQARAGSSEFILLEELIEANIASLFPGMTTGECHMFRVTRDAEVEIREDEAGDLLRTMERQVRRRRFGSYIRLEVSSSMPGEMVRYLAASLNLAAADVYTVKGPMDLSGLMVLYGLTRPDLKDAPFVPATPSPSAAAEPIFETLKRQDVLVHHPYESFSSVVGFIRAAASDPDVLAIKMTLYRAGQHSPIVKALMDASERGKQVAVLIELKARFDEENNIEWARQLERVGVHVVYGLVGLKTHSKLALVIRREGEILRRYVHIGTGNYNPSTARIYEDLGLLTSDPVVGADATHLFNFLTGYSRQTEFKRLLVAPTNLRPRLVALIEREIAHQQAGREGYIIAKLNHLTDTKMIKSLYEASQAGVRIDLLVRGICTLRPGIQGLSSTITVKSIVGRFLEHSRILYFANGGDEEVYIGSADWMLRNLDHRVELLTPIEDPTVRMHIKNELLGSYLRDNTKARRLLSNGKYERVRPAPDEAPFDVQAHFCALACPEECT